MSFANDILDAIEIMVKQVVEDNATKIYTGVCKTIGTGNCVLTINGKDNTVKYYGGVPVVGTVYQVFIPFGNMSAAFIIVPGSGGGSGGGSGVDSVNGKTGDVVLNAADVGALPTSGGTLTGKLTVGSASINTNGYVVGTWLQGTAMNHLTNAATKIAVQDGSGWVYHRTAEEIKSDIGLSNVDNVKQYSASNPPPYPVASVNGKTGGVNLIASDVGAAPAGYGLGESQGRFVTNTSVDTLTKNGWYYLYDGVTGGPSGLSIYHATLFVSSSRSDLTKVQRLILATGGRQGQELRRVYNGTAWLPWEWVNPPMELGIEYRTTERYQGKPVYVKTVPTGAMPAAGGTSNRVTVQTSIPASDVDIFIRFEGLVTNGTMSYTLPVGYGNATTEPDISGYLYKYADYVVICQSSYDMSEYSGTLTFWYTKTTD